MKTIIVYIPVFNYGGAESYIKTLLTYWNAKSNTKIFFATDITNSKNTFIEKKDLGVLHCSNSIIGVFLFLVRNHHVLRTKPIIYSHLTNSSFFGFAMKIFYGLNVYVVEHSIPSEYIKTLPFSARFKFNFYLRFFYKKLKIISVSECVQKDLKITFNIESVIIHKPPIESKNPLKNKKEGHLIVSRLSPEKDVYSFIKHYIKLGLDTKLIIIGDGIEKVKIINLISKKSNSVQLMGYQQTDYYYDQAKIVFVNSMTESFGLTIYEALQKRCFVIARNNCASREAKKLAYKAVLLYDHLEELEKLIKRAESLYIDEQSWIEIESQITTDFNLYNSIFV